MHINQPSNQVKLTNVSVVRLKKGGKRFEIACYKNKVLEWRNRLEKDLDNVIQIQQVFTNVSKGQAANQQDLLKLFKTDNVDEIVKQILDKGEIQVGEKERSQQLNNTVKDVATIICDKTVNPETKRPYTLIMIEKALSDVHFSVHPSKSTKQQAMEAIKSLSEIIPIQRAQMRVRVVMPSKDGKRLSTTGLLKPFVGTVEDELWDEKYELVCLIDPGHFRPMAELVGRETRSKGQMEVLALNSTNIESIE